MCNRWACCDRFFNVARLDPQSGRAHWLHMVRGPEPQTYYGWEACAITSLPGTDDAAVMVYSVDPETRLVSWMRVSRVTAAGQTLWETSPRERSNDVNGNGVVPLAIAADEERIYAGEPALPEIVTPTVPLLVFNHAGEAIAFPQPALLSTHIGTNVIAAAGGGCFVMNGGTIRRFDPSGATLWAVSSTLTVLCRTGDGNLFGSYGDGGETHGSILDAADGMAILDFVVPLEVGENIECAACLDDLLWLGTSLGFVRLQVSDGTFVDRIDTNRKIDALVSGPTVGGVLATSRGFSDYSDFTDDLILCFNADGSKRWEERWSYFLKNKPDSITNNDHPAPSAVSSVAVTEGGVIFVCGNSASR